MKYKPAVSATFIVLSGINDVCHAKISSEMNTAVLIMLFPLLG